MYITIRRFTQFCFVRLRKGMVAPLRLRLFSPPKTVFLGSAEEEKENYDNGVDQTALMVPLDHGRSRKKRRRRLALSLVITS